MRSPVLLAVLLLVVAFALVLSCAPGPAASSAGPPTTPAPKGLGAHWSPRVDGLTVVRDCRDSASEACARAASELRDLARDLERTAQGAGERLMAETAGGVAGEAQAWLEDCAPSGGAGVSCRGRRTSLLLAQDALTRALHQAG